MGCVVVPLGNNRLTMLIAQASNVRPAPLKKVRAERQPVCIADQELRTQEQRDGKTCQTRRQGPGSDSATEACGLGPQQATLCGRAT